MRGLRLISFLVVSSYLLTSVVYACSGLAFLPMSSMSTAMDHEPMNRGPCNDHRQDICKSVRDQMLSIQASSPLAKVAVHISTILQSAYFDVPLLVNLLPATGPPGVVLHSVFKLSFLFSNQVLRI